MSLLVPFDGSPLSEAALEKAVAYGEFVGEEPLALSVVPDDGDYARERGWIDAHDRFDPEVVVRKLRRAVEDCTPGVRFRSEVVAAAEPTGTPHTEVVRTILAVAASVGPSVVFLGSENVGRVTGELSSVGDPVAAGHRYDVYVVRTAGSTA